MGARDEQRVFGPQDREIHAPDRQAGQPRVEMRQVQREIEPGGTEAPVKFDYDTESGVHEPAIVSDAAQDRPVAFRVEGGIRHR